MRTWLHHASLDLNAPLSDTWPPFDLESMQFTEDTISDEIWSYPTKITRGPLSWNGDITRLLEFEPIQSLPIGSTPIFNQSVSKHLDPIQHTKNKSNPSTVSGQSRPSSLERVWLDSSNEEERSMPVNLDNRLSSPSHLIYGHTFMVDLGHQISTDPNSLCQEILKHLREYPSLILNRDFWSPFVHHRLYRCSLGRMAPPMADALACVGAYASTAGSGSGFVGGMITEEREKLVRNFHSYTDTPEFCLATMHAVCIYQIMGLFGASFLPAAEANI